MEKLHLNSSVRLVDENLKELRIGKQIPAVVYGHKFPSTSVKIGYSEFLKVFRVGGYTHIIELTIDGKKQDVLVHDLQKHPVTGDFQHVDFMALSAGEKIHVSIPLHIVGNAPVLREGGLLDQILHEAEVKCLPKDLVDGFDVDVSGLTALGEVMHLSDVKIDTKKFELITPIDSPIISVLETKGAKIEDEAPAEAAEVPASEQKKDKENS
ncbi:MAG: 50S ribosomal protein L25 [Candidatus Gracilibacteria bacterium]|nr:50S ribosomal protein L25 [Candidatus Gracilibacteria bacterium]